MSLFAQAAEERSSRKVIAQPSTISFSVRVSTIFDSPIGTAGPRRRLHSSQATRIRQAAADFTLATAGEGDTTDGTEAKLSELRAVINYLRKEKEIVDMQLEGAWEARERTAQDANRMSRVIWKIPVLRYRT